MCVGHGVTAHSSGEKNLFGDRLVEILNGGALSLMLSIGHRTGLFDVMSYLPAATTTEIAREAELSERYVREWLGAMVTGGIVTLDEVTRRYTLPDEHSALLSRMGSPSNFAVTMQWIPLLGAVEDEVVEAFKHGRGVPYSAYKRFHEVMAEESAQTVVGGLDEHILPLVPGLVERLEAGAMVLDVGCGRGMALMHLAARFPRSWFTGVDTSEQAIDAGRREIANRGLGNVRLEVADAAEYGPKAAFDVVLAFDAIHDQARPAAVLANVRRVLRPGGVFLMQDIKARTNVAENAGTPLAPFTYTISCMHCMSVSLAGGGPGLGAAWGLELALAMLRDAGFLNVRVEELPHDPINYYYVAPVEAAQGRRAA